MEELSSHSGVPINGEQWRVNHKIDITNGEYKRKVNSETNKPFPNFNWIWVVSGNSGYHAPELWGFVQFSDKKSRDDIFIDDKNDNVKWALRQIYYRQRAFQEEHSEYASNNAQLKSSDIAIEGIHFNPEISVMNNKWEAKQKGVHCKTVYIRWDGKTWLE